MTSNRGQTYHTMKRAALNREGWRRLTHAGPASGQKHLMMMRVKIARAAMLLTPKPFLYFPCLPLRPVLLPPHITLHCPESNP